MSEQTPEESLRQVEEAVRADPELAADVRMVLDALASTPIDPTGAPE